MRASITAIIVHWNQPLVCLDTVRGFLDLAEVDTVIVVDNGSLDENRRLLRSGLPARASIIEVGHNSGFGPAANHGWRAWLDHEAPTPWSAIAPHDAQPAPDALRELLAASELLDAPGLLSADVGDGESPIVDHVFGPITRPARVVEGYEPVDYPHGTLMLAHRACLESVGLFDERYFAYCEEADLGLRARRAGFDVGLVRGARVTNPQVNSPTDAVDYLKERNTVLLVGEHFGRRKAALRFALTIAQFLVGLLVPARRGEYWSVRGRLLAMRDIVLRRWGPPPPSLFDSSPPERLLSRVVEGRRSRDR